MHPLLSCSFWAEAQKTMALGGQCPPHLPVRCCVRALLSPMRRGPGQPWMDVGQWGVERMIPRQRVRVDHGLDSCGLLGL